MTASAVYTHAAVLKITQGDRNWEVGLSETITTIGRFTEGSANGVNLDPADIGVSRRHAEIEVVKDAFLLRNCSPNGTSVNGKPIEWVALEPGDTIRIGSATIVFAVPA